MNDIIEKYTDTQKSEVCLHSRHNHSLTLAVMTSSW